MTSMDIRYDTDADAMFVWFRDRGPHLRARILDDRRFVQVDDDGIAGIEFLDVSSGIDLDGVPHADEIRRALEAVVPA